ncbi:MAG TPA: hypothetical protein VIV82_13610, partial [Verrucomicrobiae bacterium]
MTAMLAALVLMKIAIASSSLAAEATNVLEIQSVSVNGNALPMQKGGSVNLGTQPENIVFGFGP